MTIAAASAATVRHVRVTGHRLRSVHAACLKAAGTDTLDRSHGQDHWLTNHRVYSLSTTKIKVKLVRNDRVIKLTLRLSGFRPALELGLPASDTDAARRGELSAVCIRTMSTTETRTVQRPPQRLQPRLGSRTPAGLWFARLHDAAFPATRAAWYGLGALLRDLRLRRHGCRSLANVAHLRGDNTAVVRTGIAVCHAV